MRQNLIDARESADLAIPQMAALLKITERYYRYIEAGRREGKGYIWDKLQDLFGIDQRELRKVAKTTQAVNEDGPRNEQKQAL